MKCPEFHRNGWQTIASYPAPRLSSVRRIAAFPPCTRLWATRLVVCSQTQRDGAPSLSVSIGNHRPHFIAMRLKFIWVILVGESVFESRSSCSEGPTWDFPAMMLLLSRGGC